MSKQHDDATPLTDEDLLANAIPIEDIEEAEPVEDDPTSEDESRLPQIDLAEPVESSGPSKIRRFGDVLRHEEKWSRKPNVTGQGAIHVKTFIAKLRLDAIEHMDQQINEWLDEHPDYEVKFVTSSIGELVGKLKEPAVFLNVWV